jgi:ABC-type multidrug transport system fused ATPase/permease subunit
LIFFILSFGAAAEILQSVLSAIMEMDRIIVMEEGRVVDEGTHDELLQKVGIYQKLWNIQAGGFADSD